MSAPIRYFFYACLLIVLQLYVLNQIGLGGGKITPYLYHLFILWLPFTLNRSGLLIIAFLYGLCFDVFNKTQGLHTMGCLWIAFLRPLFVTFSIRQEGQELNFESPSFKSFGVARYLVYAIILTAIHHTVVLFLTFLQVGGFLSFIWKTIVYTFISMLLIIVMELLVSRQQAYKTNT
jgi:heme exporter protein D